MSGGPASSSDLGERHVAALAAIAERLVPSDDAGPGAREACAVRYVLGRLGQADIAERERYALALDALEVRALDAHGATLADLPADAQDGLLRALEAQEVEGAPDGFFDLLLRDVLEGTFGDPVHGGNEGRCGWQLLGYPGPRSSWSEADQQLDAVVALMHEREPRA